MNAPSKPNLNSNIKSITLKATAAAVLALSVDVAMAAPCPTSINNSTLNGVCTMTTGETVTITNTGTIIGGIQANSGISAVSIDNAGVINSISTAIQISSASLSGAISNSGSITATQWGISVINGASVVGGISNTGSITAGIDGIQVVGGSSVDGIVNDTNGLIASTNGNGISVNSATVSSGISNAGSIDAGITGIAVSGNSTVSGSIANTGSITAAQSGISVFNGASVVGGISNTGSIDAGSSVGIGVNGAFLSGGISNTGSITAGGNGIQVISISSVTGGISNTGSITAGSNGIRVTGGSSVDDIVNDTTGLITSTNGNGIAISNATVSSGISNAGSITAGSDGINVAGGSSVDGIINDTTGLITSTNGNGIEINTATVSSGISNAGSITVAQSGISLINGASVVGGISNTGSIDTVNQVGIAVTSAFVSGGISNAGSITAGSNGIQAITGSSVSGGISNAGTITAGNNGIQVIKSSSVSGGISNTGTITAVNTGIGIFTSSVTGGIANSGSISAETGILVSANASVSGGVSNNNGVLSGSIVNFGSITNTNGTGIAVTTAIVTGGITNGGVIQGSAKAISVNTLSTVPNLDIVGTNAHIIGDVNAIQTDVNIVTGANFTSEGGFVVQNFNIQSGAAFTMANQITAGFGAGALTNGGTLSIASGTTPQTLHGNYTQSTGGRFQIGATNTTNYGQLHTNGDVNLAASGAIDVQLSPDSSFQQGDVLHDVILSSGTFTPNTNYSVTDNSFLWIFTAENNEAGTGVDLTTSLNPAAFSACRGTYCEKAAAVILGQLTIGNPAFSPFQLATTNEFAIAAAQSTPELVNENFQVTQFLTRAARDRTPMWNALRGQSTGDAMLYQPGKFWLKPYASSISQRQRTTVNGYHADAYGVVLGKDIQLTDTWMLGGALAGGYDKMTGKSVLDGQSITTDAYQAIIYATKQLPNHIYFAGQGLLGLGLNDTERFMPVFASTAKGNYHSWFTNLALESGWSFPLNQQLLFTPAINASYLYINQAGFIEKGSVMALNVQENNNNSLLLGADANLAYHAATSLAQQNLTLTAHVGIAYDVLNNQPTTTATFLAGGPAFSTYGIQYSDAVCRAGLGIALDKPQSPFSLNLNYDLQNGNNGYSGLVSATLKYKT